MPVERRPCELQLLAALRPRRDPSQTRALEHAAGVRAPQDPIVTAVWQPAKLVYLGCLEQIRSLSEQCLRAEAPDLLPVWTGA
mmetsp:Transcript_66444/g.156476  ORF Transcript_66444/g.156476 Transcript_66444/m.156476 type:complete len:83 (-) Transcript_66444:4389-4637(-)